jgi:hypothetical protein
MATTWATPGSPLTVIRASLTPTSPGEKTLTADVTLNPGASQLTYQLGGTGFSMTPWLWTLLIVAAALATAAAGASWRMLRRRRRPRHAGGAVGAQSRSPRYGGEPGR